jgi:hypothetical protein
MCKTIFSSISIIIISSLTACYTRPAPLALIPARQIEVAKITLGNVQKNIKVGASASEVIQVISSPNIITSNPDGGEIWIYDKIANENEFATGLNSGVSVSSSRTLIVVIKFDKLNKVESVQYRQTSY